MSASAVDCVSCSTVRMAAIPTGYPRISLLDGSLPVRFIWCNTDLPFKENFEFLEDGLVTGTTDHLRRHRRVRLDRLLEFLVQGVDLFYQSISL